MRIGIDARFFGPRVGGGGLGRYVAEFVTWLQRIDKENDYVLFLGKENFHECVITNSRFHKRLVDVPWYSLTEQFVMRREVELQKLNLVHYPHWNIPVLCRTPFVVTIHDLILLDDPDSARATTRGAVVHAVKTIGYRIALEAAIHRSRHILTVSDFTRQAILRHFRVAPAKVSTIANGVIPPIDVHGVSLRDMGVVEPYILSVGNAYPHKNLGLLLRAFAHIHESHKDVMLVHAGKNDVFAENLLEEARELGLPHEAVKFLDLPTDAQLAALYKHASMFVIPSRIEGFGIPPLEAMSYGTPVAAARASSLPEVLLDAAVFFDPDDADHLANILAKALDRPHEFDDLRRIGPRHAARFTWEKTAQAIHNVYMTTANRRP